MSEIVINFLTYMIKGVFIGEIINGCLKTKTSMRKKIVLLICYALGFYIVRAEDYKGYIYRHLYTFGIYYIYSKKGKEQNKMQIPVLCSSLGMYEIISMITNVVTVIVISFLPFQIQKATIGMVVFSIIVRLSILFLCYRLINKRTINLDTLLNRRYLIYIIFVLTVSIKVPFLYTEVMYGAQWKVVFISIICCTAIFFVILQLDRHNAAKEKARIEENNKKLNTKLHQSQEILPAVVQILNDVTINNGTKMEENKAHKLLEEVSTLLSQQRKENGKYDLKLKTFYSTGLEILDMQLNIYQSEAIEKKVNLDIYVQAPIDKVIKEKGIDQLRLQRAIGDLVRNAFNAVGKKQDAEGHILVVIGCQNEGILEIIVMDDGNEFPLHVLEDFGRRGNTLGGTGNGLADLTEFAKDVNASIYVEEFEEGADSFTKKISLIFDDSGINFIESKRKGLIKSSCGKK